MKKRTHELKVEGDPRAHDVVLLKTRGMSRRAIARSLKMGRNTVRGVLADHQQQRQDGAPLIVPRPASTRGAKLDSHKDAILRLLATYADITAQRCSCVGTSRAFSRASRRANRVRCPSS